MYYYYREDLALKPLVGGQIYGANHDPIIISNIASDHEYIFTQTKARQH